MFLRFKQWLKGYMNPPSPAKILSSPIDDFLETSVEDIMIPRSDIIAINYQLPFEEVVKKFLRTGLQWLPVFRDTLDTITGIVSIHCIISLKESDNEENRWNRHLNQASFSPNSLTIREALHHFHHHHKNPVIFVVDEYGGIEGMLTKGHILKALSGLCMEEILEEEEMIISRHPLWVINGRMDLETFKEELGYDSLFTDHDEARVNTIGGWLCSYIGRVPLTGEVISHSSGFIFEIRQATPRKIHQIAIRSFPLAVGEEETPPKG